MQVSQVNDWSSDHNLLVSCCSNMTQTKRSFSYVLMKEKSYLLLIFQWLGVLYFDKVVAATSGVLKLKGVEGQVDGLVDRHLNGPQAVHPGLVARIQVWIWRTKHAHGHGQVAATSLCRPCRQFRNKHFCYAIGNFTLASPSRKIILSGRFKVLMCRQGRIVCLWNVCVWK